MDEFSLTSVLTIESTDQKIAQTIIQNTKEKIRNILTLNSMQSVTSNDVAAGTGYLSIMESNLNVLKKLCIRKEIAMSQLICQGSCLGLRRQGYRTQSELRVNAGDYFCIVGENGSGKSTLMRTLLHLQPPVSGSILTGDGLKTNEIGYLPSRPLYKGFSRIREEIVLSGCQGAAEAGRFIRRRKRTCRRKTWKIGDQRVLRPLLP